MTLPRAVALLGARRWAEGAQVLERVLEGPLTEGQRGPALGMYAQALLELGRLDEAKDAVRQAMRVAKGLGDSRGLAQLRALNGRVYGELAARQDRQRVELEEAQALERPLAELLAEAADDRARADVHLRKANARIDRGEDGAALARAGLELARSAGAVREQVLCMLCLARVEDTEGWLRQAHTLADDAEEPQLVAAIAKAARTAGVDFGTHCF